VSKVKKGKKKFFSLIIFFFLVGYFCFARVDCSDRDGNCTNVFASSRSTRFTFSRTLEPARADSRARRQVSHQRCEGRHVVKKKKNEKQKKKRSELELELQPPSSSSSSSLGS
jgi:hypothetical protein